MVFPMAAQAVPIKNSIPLWVLIPLVFTNISFSASIPIYLIELNISLYDLHENPYCTNSVKYLLSTEVLSTNVKKSISL